MLKFRLAECPVDGHAKLALNGHPQQDPSVLTRVQLYEQRAKSFLNFAVRTLPIQKVKLGGVELLPAAGREIGGVGVGTCSVGLS